MAKSQLKIILLMKKKKTTQIMPWKPLQGDGGVGFMLTLSIAYLVSFM
jgi:hypothetical protein